MNGYRKRGDTGQNGHHQKVYKQQIWPSNPTAGRHPEVTDTCTPTFTAALFTIARTRKQPRCPLADERIRQLWYIYNGMLLKYKQDRTWVSSTEVDEPGACYTEWSKSEREILYITHILEFRKMVPMTLHAGQQRRHRRKEQTLGLSGRSGWEDLRE